jgi:hypothetical protein
MLVFRFLIGFDLPETENQVDATAPGLEIRHDAIFTSNMAIFDGAGLGIQQ